MLIYVVRIEHNDEDSFLDSVWSSSEAATARCDAIYDEGYFDGEARWTVFCLDEPDGEV